MEAATPRDVLEAATPRDVLEAATPREVLEAATPREVLEAARPTAALLLRATGARAARPEDARPAEERPRVGRRSARHVARRARLAAPPRTLWLEPPGPVSTRRALLQP